MHASKTLLVTTWLALCGALPAQGQRAHLGFHGGYNFDLERGLLGAQVLLPLGRTVELYPSFDYYFVDAGSLVGFNGDIKFRVPTGGPSVLYLGGGVNIQRASAGGASSSDTGWDLFGGLESRLGVTHPYIEGRVLNHNNSAFQIAVGLNFTLY